MPLRRRPLLAHAAAALASAVLPTVFPSAGYAQSPPRWPARPITIVDPFAAGGNTDYFSRLLADRLGPLLGTTVLVENKAGAGGLIGAAYVARAKPDGYTLGLASVSTLCAGPAVYGPQVARYDAQKDFSFITKLVTLPSLLVSSLKLPVKDFAGLLALAKSKPGQVTFGVPGIGSAGHVLTEYMARLAGVKFLIVPYKTGAAMLTDLISGQLDVVSNNIPDLLPHVRNNSIRALAVRDIRRLPALPNLPTYKDLGLAEVSNPLWFGLVAPAGLPEDIAQRIRVATHKAMVDRGFIDKTLAVSASLSPSTGPEFRTDAARLLAHLQDIVKTAGIKAE